MRTDNNIEELEAKLLERFGTENHFTVPEGYFDKLPGRVASRIAQRKRRRLAWKWAAAAILVGCVFTGGMLFERQEAAKTANAEEVQYIEDALNYSMIDNMSIASYLTEADYN
ncbi:MAG: hypothetical protein IJ219_01905 [Bacteroidaceae bacterium]|nr:hypothetical protein [Bacteroidaceae bacterium]MBQ9293668.1 hypothetical protein [Bacteroidaceae bacterium]